MSKTVTLYIDGVEVEPALELADRLDSLHRALSAAQVGELLIAATQRAEWLERRIKAGARGGLRCGEERELLALFDGDAANPGLRALLGGDADQLEAFRENGTGPPPGTEE